jgi:predicted DsbA family dithiol-disulfide isomerase
MKVQNIARVALTVGVACILTWAQNINGSSPDAVLAEVDGQKLTVTEFDQAEGNRLLQSRFEYYEAERKALDDLIDKNLLETQARKENVTVDQLLQREVYSKVAPDPTDDQLHVYYEGMDSEKPFDELKDKIRQHIHDARANTAKATYLKGLRSQAKIFIHLSPPSANVDLSDTFVKGNKDAQVILVEFADYQCPYCQKVHPELDQLQREFGNRLAIANKDFPLPMHPYAMKAAEAARCAGMQGKFWEFHDLLFSDKKLEVKDLKEQARTLHLDGERFDSCLDSGQTAGSVERDADEGRRLGLTGTPSFFVNGHFSSGALSYATLRDMVAQQLNSSLSSTKPTQPMESSLR